MRKFILAATTIAALAVPAIAIPTAAMAAPTGNTTNAAGDVTCRGDLTTNVMGDLRVPAGATCKAMYVEINGDTTVEGHLSAASATFDGKVLANGGSFDTFNGGAHIHGSLKIMNSWGDANGNNGFWSDYGPTVIDGKFTYINNGAPLYMEGSNTVYGKFTYGGNAHPYSGNLVTHGHNAIS